MGDSALAVVSDMIARPQRLPQSHCRGIVSVSRMQKVTAMASEQPALHPETVTAQGMGRVAQPHRDIVPPIYVATTYERGADGSYPGGRVYSRADNPSYDQAEALIASLEGAAAAMVFASGQAAAATVFQALAPGDCALAPRSMYWAFR